MFHQRSYDRWKGEPDWKGREGRGNRGGGGESGPGREGPGGKGEGKGGGEVGPGHELSNFFKPGLLIGQWA